MEGFGFDFGFDFLFFDNVLLILCGYLAWYLHIV